MSTIERDRHSGSDDSDHDAAGEPIDYSRRNRYLRGQGRLRLLIEQLPNGRKSLHLKGADVIAIPNELFDLTDLDVLDMTPECKSGMNFTITRVPANLQFLSNLKCLHLDNNNLTSLPSEIGDLPHLEIFTASHNQLTALPQEMRRLQGLQSCHLANNRIAEMPVCLCYLTKSLLFLDLSCNYLRRLPASIQHLKELRTLLLTSNRLKTLPNTLCQLTHLETLWLGDNKLKELPKDFAQLTRLSWNSNYELSSNFEGNPLEDPPLNICRQGMDAIERHLREKHE